MRASIVIARSEIPRSAGKQSHLRWDRPAQNAGLPVILIDRLEACPTMEIPSGWRSRNDISRHVAFSNGAKGTIHF